MIIDWRVIPHSEQAYETVGNYWEDGDTVHFRVSKLSDHRYEWLIFLHEFAEYFLGKFMGVRIEDIDAFDAAYEKARAQKSAHAPCGCKIQEEPGFDRHAPYRWQHYTADMIERLACSLLNVDWVAYEKEVDALYLPTD